MVDMSADNRIVIKNQQHVRHCCGRNVNSHQLAKCVKLADKSEVDIEMSTCNTAVKELSKNIKGCAKMVLLKKNELGILADCPNGATIGGKAIPSKNVKE